MAKWIVAAVVMGFVLVMWSGYNNLVSAEEGVKSGWSEVQSQVKRRYDLIPNLVNTVKGYAEHERGVFAEVTAARAKVGQMINVDASKLANDPLLQKQLLDAAQGLNASFSRLIAVAENYPQLKANDNFLKLQDELAGTENRIAVARGRAIKATQDYNKMTRQLPTTLVARLAGFTYKEYYEAPESEQQTPNVDFNRKS